MDEREQMKGICGGAGIIAHIMSLEWCYMFNLRHKRFIKCMFYIHRLLKCLQDGTKPKHNLKKIKNNNFRISSVLGSHIFKSFFFFLTKMPNKLGSDNIPHQRLHITPTEHIYVISTFPLISITASFHPIL